jgi:nucleotide-binding universal stress UspA family protein
MSYLMMESASFRAEAASQQGPVLLATKPFVGLDEPVLVARWLAKREERPLRVVSVLERHDTVALAAGLTPVPANFYAAECAMLATQIRSELADEGEDTTPVHVDVLDGDSTHEIVESARLCDARVIVVGTGRHDTIGRFLYGERALQILGAADRPVLVVPRGARAGPVSTAVVAVDFSEASLRAARAIAPMMSSDGRLLLVHVWPTDAAAPDAARDQRYAQGCITQFAAFRRQLPSLPGVQVETHCLRGDAVRMLLEFARASDAGLIACGRLGHTLVERVFVGSVSSALVRQATCPVLVAPFSSQQT